MTRWLAFGQPPNSYNHFLGLYSHYRTRKPSAGSWVERRGGLTIGVFPTYAVGVDRETRWATIQVFQYPTALMG